MKVRTGLIAAALVPMGATSALAAEECAGKRGPTQLSVQVSGVQPAKGEVAVTVYPDERLRFLAPGGKLLRQRVKAQAVSKACFWLPEGHYAIAVYHDANGDRDFNRSSVGLPTEGFGFSNDAPTRLGIPSFEAVRFRVRPGQGVLNIRMRYGR